MPLGDSITGLPGCWRAYLWQKLQAANITNIDFVGSLKNEPNACGFAFDDNNEGHGGFQAVNIANQNLLPPWLSTAQPDVVTVHLGTNDIVHNVTTSNIITAFGKLVDQMRASNPRMVIIVAQIIPMYYPPIPECPQRVIDLNAAIAKWAPTKSTLNSPITVVDQWTGFNDTTMTLEGIHPNDIGSRRMADVWFKPVVNGIQRANLVIWVCSWLRC